MYIHVYNRYYTHVRIRKSHTFMKYMYWKIHR